MRSIEYVGDGFRERIFRNAAKHNVPITGEFEITTNCNYKCIHCYATLDRRRCDVDYDFFVLICNQLRKAGCMFLLITGGEPLIHPDFDDMWKYAHKLGFKLSLFSNGSLFSERYIDLLREFPPEVVEVSVYSTKEDVHKAITGRGLYTEVKNLTMLKGYVEKLVVKTPLLSLNVDEIGTIQGIANRHELSFRMDAIVHPTLNQNTSPTKFRVPYKVAAQLAMEDPEMQRQLRHSFSHNTLPFATDGLKFPCSAGKYSFHVDPEGYLNLCSIYRNTDLNLHEMPFSDAWRDLSILGASPCGEIKIKCDTCRLKCICPNCPAVSRLFGEDERYIDTFVCNYTAELARIAGIV
ncbi:radical SAM protein [Desulfovibrio sp. Huiquan2017]|uniref:radical SAM protein n=1 Tax=Desulfovibrio sp. Huiquan2017 TaxID=2816861 RepID=UPI001A93479C|nr:radical SAM protein [Desulfovibrio sp. Huiquan2017]